MQISALISNPESQYIAWGILVGLLILHWVWCQFISFPIGFEKHLKRGKPWVYIPLRWKGSYKIQIQYLSRLILLGTTLVGILLMSYYTRRQSGVWYVGFGLAIGFVLIRLNAIWLSIPYHQQEDSYYFLHDELRAKLESEGKDMGESAFKSLAAYQHQNLLRKADEQGILIKTLRQQAKISRKHRKEFSRAEEPVES